MTVVSPPEDSLSDEPFDANTDADTAAAVGADPRRADLRNTAALVSFTAVTNLADGVTKVALPLLATRLTSSPLQVTGVALALSLPWLVTALHIGVLVDRLDRRRLLVLANAMRVGAVAALLAAVLGHHPSLPVLYAVGIVLGVAEVIALTAAAALVPSAVSRDGQERANAWMTAAETVCNDFCGPFVGGVLVAIGYAFALGAASIAFLATLALPALLVGRLRPAAAAAAQDAPRPAVHTQISQGLGFLWRQPLLRTMALTLTVLCLCWGAWLAIIPVLATRTLHLDARGYGLILSALGVGGFVGAVSSAALSRAVGRRWVMFGDLVGTFAMVAAPVLLPDPVAVGVSAFLGGMGGTLWTVNARTLSQRLVPPQMMGRFHSAWRLFSWGALPVGSALVGVFADLAGVRASFVPFAVAVALLAIPFLRVLTPQAIASAQDAQPPAAASTAAPAAAQN